MFMRTLGILTSIAALSVALGATGLVLARGSGQNAPPSAPVPQPSVGHPASVGLPLAEYARLRAEATGMLERGEFEAAADAWERLARAYPDDGLNWAQLAYARISAGRWREAIEAYQRTRDLGVMRPFAVDISIAQAYAQLGEKDEAYRWLERTLASGIEDRRLLEREPALRPLAEDDRFRAMLGDAPAREFTREEGWRLDLDYLVSEVKRLHWVYRTRALPREFERGVAALRERIPSLGDDAVAVEMQRLMAMLGDGHTLLFPMTRGGRWMPRLAFRFYAFSDGVFVVDAPEEHARWIGARVVRVGRVETMGALERLAPFVARDNPNGIKVFGMAYLALPAYLHGAGVIDDPSRVEFTLEDRAGRQETIAVGPDQAPGPQRGRDFRLTPSRLPGAPPPPLYLRDTARHFAIEPLDVPGTVYVQFNMVLDQPGESLRDFALRLRRHLDDKRVRTLIVDARHDNGGDAGLRTPLLRTLIHFETTRENARLYIIIGRLTFSAAQPFINEADRLTNAVFVGETSGSRPNFVGESTTVLLPFSRVRGEISSRYQQSDCTDDRIWIAPELPVALSSEDYFQNRDPVLDALIEYVRAAEGDPVR